MAPKDDASSFADIARLLQAEPDLPATMDQILELAREHIECDYASITLLTANRRLETAASTHEVVRQGDALQYELAEGPCLQAVWSHETYLVDDLEHDSRWPTWGPQAAKLGLLSILAVQLFTMGETQGALNLYAGAVDGFDENDVALAHVFGAHASVALATARNEEHMRKAVDARHLIGQAQGILMERFQIDADRAFDVLRRHSSTRNMKLHVVAAELVEHRTLMAQAPPEQEPS